MAGAQVAGLIASLGGGLTSVSLFSSTTSTASTIAWPGSLQAGDLALLTDYAGGVSVPTTVVPSGFTQIANVVGGTVSRMIESYRILDGTETGNITGMSSVGQTKVLRIFRGNKAIVTVTPSTWNGEGTTGNPSPQVVSAPGSVPCLILGAATGGSFSTASPAFDGTQAVGTTSVTGYKIYNASPAAHTIDIGDGSTDILMSGSLILA